MATSLQARQPCSKRCVASLRNKPVLWIHPATQARRAACTAVKVMIAGAPGSGKGTQCLRIVEKYGLVHIAVGDLLRQEVAAQTEAGLKAKGFMDSGNLVPDEVVVDMVVDRLSQQDVAEAGWLLDGYPRSASQAEAINKREIRPDVFLLINVPDEEMVNRVLGRRIDPETGNIYHLQYNPPPPKIAPRLIQRADDTAEKAETRLKVYHDNMQAVKDYYTDQIVEIDGNVEMDEVFEQVKAALDHMYQCA